MSSSFERDQRKRQTVGWVMTALVHAVLLVIFYFFGLTYQDPPPEEGISLDFGYEEQGFGQTEQTATEPVPPTPSDPTEASAVTQDVDPSDVSVDDKPKPKPVERPKPTETKPVEPTKPQPSKQLSSHLNKLKTTGTGSGSGTTQGGGNQGNPNGTLNGGDGGTDQGTQGTGDYNLGNRVAISKPQPEKGCGEEGRVVVKVYVDRNGIVVSAKPGASGSTTTSSCLFDRARKAALRTKWAPDPDALERQVGTIIYRFELN
jgi:outer membrane biosynthesis protein TonB